MLKISSSIKSAGVALCGALLVLVLTACGSSDDSAHQAAGHQAGKHDDLKNAVQRPIDKAKAVEDQVLSAAERQREALEKAEGSDADGKVDD